MPYSNELQQIYICSIMDAYEQIASKIISISEEVASLNRHKAEFAKSISYQINSIFQQLGRVSPHDNSSLKINSLQRSLTSRQVSYLVNLKNKGHICITPQDICDYLHISRHNIKRNSNIQNEPDSSSVDEFFNILQKEQEIQNNFIDKLRQVELENWFAEVDFFSNGYIDTSALCEFLLHYGSQSIEEYKVLSVIRLIKRHSQSDKLFLQDIKQYLEPVTPELASSAIDPSRWHRATASAIDPYSRMEEIRSKTKNYSQQMLLSLQSQVSFFSPSHMVSNVSIDPPPQAIVQQSDNPSELRNTTLLTNQFSPQNIQQPQITYEQRLIRIHSRNAKYIQRLKRQMSNVVPICTLEVQSHLRNIALKNTEKQLLTRVALLGQVYNRKCSDIARFITDNPKFTFLNAFELMDIDQTNKITIEKWKKFGISQKLQTTTIRSQLFFQKISENGIIRFSDYLKIFKHSGCQNEYQQCQKRQPLFYEQWSFQLIDKFNALLTRILKYVEQQQIMREELTKRKSDLENIFSRHTFCQQYIELVGSEYENFVRDHYKEKTLDIFL